MNCSSCSRNISDDSRFCPYCGGAVVIPTSGSSMRTAGIVGASAVGGGIVGNLLSSRPAHADTLANNQVTSNSNDNPTIDRVNSRTGVPERGEENEGDIFDAYDDLIGSSGETTSSDLDLSDSSDSDFSKDSHSSSIYDL